MKQKVRVDLSTVYSNKTTNLSGLTIGERGCFSDSEDFKDYEIYELIRVMNTSKYPYVADIGGGYSRGFKYYIPLNKANFEDINSSIKEQNMAKEVKEVLSIGNTFWVRSKDNTEIAHLVTVTQISVNSEGSIVSIGLGTDVFPPKELLKNYEWSSKPPKDNDWQSFSISLTF